MTERTVMSLAEASEIVAADQRQSWPDCSDAELLDRALEVVVFDQLLARANEDDEVDHAYLVFLAHRTPPTRPELYSLLKRATAGQFWAPSLVEEVWLARIASGDLA